MEDFFDQQAINHAVMNAANEVGLEKVAHSFTAQGSTIEDAVLAPIDPIADPIADAINPSHYKDILPGYEYMDMMEHILGFEGTVEHLRGQIFKYLLRFGKKDARTQEAGKVAWYSNRLEDVLKRNESGQFPKKVS